MGCSGCGQLQSNCGGGCKDCKKVSGKSLPNNNPCDPNYTGDLIYDGDSFECENGPGFTITTNTNLNTVLNTMFTDICNIYSILDSESNVMTSAITFDGTEFSCPTDPDIAIEPGDNMNDILATIFEKLCEFSNVITFNHLYVGVAPDQAITAGAGFTLISGATLTVPAGGDGDYMARTTLDAILAAGSECVIALFKNNVLLVDSSIPKNLSHAGETPYRCVGAIIHKVTGLVAGDDIDVRIIATTANATVPTCNLELDQKS